MLPGRGDGESASEFNGIRSGFGTRPGKSKDWVLPGLGRWCWCVEDSEGGLAKFRGGDGEIGDARMRE